MSFAGPVNEDFVIYVPCSNLSRMPVHLRNCREGFQERLLIEMQIDVDEYTALVITGAEVERDSPDKGRRLSGKRPGAAMHSELVTRGCSPRIGFRR